MNTIQKDRDVDDADVQHFPLSPMQERQLLFEHDAQRQGFRPAPFCLPWALHLSRNVDVIALRGAVARVIANHATLRTTFSPHPRTSRRDLDMHAAFFARTHLFLPGLLRQSVHACAGASLDFRRIPDEPSGSTRPELAKVIKEEYERPFDYSSPPLMRTVVLERPSGERLLLCVLHHLIADRWSLNLLARDIKTHYESVQNGSDASAAASPAAHYPGLVLEHYRMWRSGRAIKSRDYWTERWTHAAEYQWIPGGPSPTPDANGRFGVRYEELALDSQLTVRTHRSARRARATLFTFALTAIVDALRLYGRRDHLAIWTAFANRTQPGSDNLIAWFSHSHLLMFDCATHVFPSGLLRHVMNVVSDAMRNQDVSLPLLWQHLGHCPEAKGDRLTVTLRRDDTTEGSNEPFTPVPPFRGSWFFRHPVRLALEIVARRDSLVFSAASAFLSSAELRSLLTSIHASLLALTEQ